MAKIEDLSKLGKVTKASKEDIEFMNQPATRMDVSNYVNALLEEVYVPNIMGVVDSATRVILSILIMKGVVTEDELTKIFTEMQEKAQQDLDNAEAKKKAAESEEKENDDAQ